MSALLVGLACSEPRESLRQQASATLRRMLDAYERGAVDGTEYYGGTSADVQANYLTAYANASDALSPDARARSNTILDELTAKSIHKGDCVGWGIGVPLDAFGDGTINPADTIFLYTTSRVILAETEAIRAGTIDTDQRQRQQEACALKSLFHFDPTIPRLQYSDNPNDAKYLVFNVFADLGRAALALNRDLDDPSLVAMARDACRVLAESADEAGYVPYFKGRGDTDPTHHAMVIVGLFECATALNTSFAPALRASDYLVSNYIGAKGERISPQPDQEWAVGEGLRAMTLACAHSVKYCPAVDAYLRYVVDHEKDGLVNNNDLRFQSWLAAGMAYALRHYKS